MADDRRTGQADAAPQAHIDAVADALVQSIREHTGITKPDLVMWNYDVVKAAGIESRALLDSTDPAVHAALAASLPIEVLIAELVERGRLEQVSFADWWGTVSRYVTKWEAP